MKTNVYLFLKERLKWLQFCDCTLLDPHIDLIQVSDISTTFQYLFITKCFIFLVCYKQNRYLGQYDKIQRLVTEPVQADVADEVSSFSSSLLSWNEKSKRSRNNDVHIEQGLAVCSQGCVGENLESGSNEIYSTKRYWKQISNSSLSSRQHLVTISVCWLG